MTERDIKRIELIARCAERAYEVHVQAVLANLPRYGHHTNDVERKAIAGAHNLLGSLSSIRSVCRSLIDHPGERPLTDEDFTDYLDRWLEDQSVLMHSTTLERIADGAEEFFEGERRSYREWFNAA